METNTTLRLRRIQRGMSQAALAASAGISQQLMSKLEKGKIALTPERAQTFAALLGCKAIDLLPAFAGQPVPEGNEEAELLRIYRALTPDKRAMLAQIARTFRMETPAEPFNSAIAN
jgi:transcriptional regulator with XRE-family HTH domain